MHESERQSEVTQSCPTLRNPMDCSLPGSSVHGIFQARVLEWVYREANIVQNTDSVPELGSSPKVGNGTLLQYSCLENPMDGGAW